MSMNLGNLLQMIRQDYLDTLQEAFDDAVQADSRAALEPALENPPTLGAELWADYVAQGTTHTVASEGLFQFTETITFGWGDALPGQPDPLQVVVKPFAWDAMGFTVKMQGAANLAPLHQWLEQWATEPEPFATDGDDEEGEEEPYRQVVHSLKAGKAPYSWVADMGSAPLEAWQDLLEALLAMGATRVEFSTPPIRP
jgi:hypothetical protein